MGKERFKAPPKPWSLEQTNDLKRRFLQGLREHGTVYHAARAADISRTTAYAWRQDDPEFAREWAEALEDNTEKLEASLYQRAFTSDVLGIFMAKARRPEVYRDNYKIDVNMNIAGDADAIRDAVAGAIGALGALGAVADSQERGSQEQGTE